MVLSGWLPRLLFYIWRTESNITIFHLSNVPLCNVSRKILQLLLRYSWISFYHCIWAKGMKCNGKMYIGTKKKTTIILSLSYHYKDFIMYSYCFSQLTSYRAQLMKWDMEHNAPTRCWTGNSKWIRNPAPLAKAVKTLNSKETNVFSHFPFQK